RKRNRRGSTESEQSFPVAGRLSYPELFRCHPPWGTPEIRHRGWSPKHPADAIGQYRPAYRADTERGAFQRTYPPGLGSDGIMETGIRARLGAGGLSASLTKFIQYETDRRRRRPRA